MVICVVNRVENIVGNGENAGCKQLICTPTLDARSFLVVKSLGKELKHSTILVQKKNYHLWISVTRVMF